VRHAGRACREQQAGDDPAGGAGAQFQELRWFGVLVAACQARVEDERDPVDQRLRA